MSDTKTTVAQRSVILSAITEAPKGHDERIRRMMADLYKNCTGRKRMDNNRTHSAAGLWQDGAGGLAMVGFGEIPKRIPEGAGNAGTSFYLRSSVSMIVNSAASQVSSQDCSMVAIGLVEAEDIPMLKAAGIVNIVLHKDVYEQIDKLDGYFKHDVFKSLEILIASCAACGITVWGVSGKVSQVVQRNLSQDRNSNTLTHRVFNHVWYP